MARSVSPSLTSRFTQLVGAPGDAAHQGLLDDLARQPGLASALLQVALGAPAEARARGLALLHPYLTSAEERNRAEFAISQLPAEHRAVVYGLMAAAAADAATHRRWFEAELAAINELTSDVKRIAALERAAEHTSGALWDGLLAAAGAIRNEARRGKAFRQLLPRVPDACSPPSCAPCSRHGGRRSMSTRWRRWWRWSLTAHSPPCASVSSTFLRIGARKPSPR